MNILKITREDVLEYRAKLKENPDFLAISNQLLSDAAQSLDPEYVKVLIDIGAKPDAEILHSLAFIYGQETATHGDLVIQIVALLLNAGANPNYSDSIHGTPIDICDTFNAIKLKNIFKQYAANKNL